MLVFEPRQTVPIDLHASVEPNPVRKKLMTQKGYDCNIREQDQSQ